MKLASDTTSLGRRAREVRFNPLRSLTPESLARQLDDYAMGDFRDVVQTWQEIARRDDVLGIAWPKRAKAVSRLGYDIVQVEEIPEGMKETAAAHAATLRWAYDNLVVRDATKLDQRGEARLLFQQIMGAVAYGYAAHEILWRPMRDHAGKWRYSAELVHVPLWAFEARSGRLRYVGAEYLTQGKDLDDDWLISVGDEPMMFAASIAWMFKSLSLRDWVGVLEFAAQPPVIGKTTAAKDSPEYTALEEAVGSVGAEFRAVLTGDADIKFGDVKAGPSADLYSRIVERMDRALSALCRGADLSTMSAGSGSGEGASLQGDEADILEEDDSAFVAESLRKFERRLIELTYGPGVLPLAYLKISSRAQPDDQADLAKVEKAVSMGVPVGERWFRERFQIPAPDPTDTLLRAPAPPAAPGGLPGFGNERQRGGTPVRFEEIARSQFGQALGRDLYPVLAELREIAALDDQPLQRRRLAQLRDRLPEVLRTLGRDSESARALERILGAAVADGLLSGAAARVTPTSAAR